MTQITPKQVLDVLFGKPKISQQQQQFSGVAGAQQQRFSYENLPALAQAQSLLSASGLAQENIDQIIQNVTQTAFNVMSDKAGYIFNGLAGAGFKLGKDPQRPLGIIVEGMQVTFMDIEKIHDQMHDTLEGKLKPLLTLPEKGEPVVAQLA